MLKLLTKEEKATYLQNKANETGEKKKTCSVKINQEMNDPLIQDMYQTYHFGGQEDQEKVPDFNLKKLMLKLEKNTINDLILLKYYPERQPKIKIPYLILIFGCNEIVKIRSYPKHQKLINYNQET
jgi:hypothetical protein